jgi:hypothetical protein
MDAPRLLAQIRERVRAVFERLEAYSYLTSMDRVDFAYYRTIYERALCGIEARIASGSLEPLDLEGFPYLLRASDYKLQAALFMGSFDPFQMTHLAMALRYLSSPRATAQAVFVVAEGHDNPAKPRKSDYHYRMELIRMQLSEIFHPFIVPLSIGDGADTMEIVRRFMALFPGSELELTHLLGSDALPYAAKLLPEDLKVWRCQADVSGVSFSYRPFVIRRHGGGDPGPQLETLRSFGIEAYLDDEALETPSSTDFRERNAFSIVFPTDEIVRHLEVVFRYNLNKPWASCYRL